MQIAGLQDFRGQGVPADIGIFQFPSTALVFQFNFSGTTYIVSMQLGISGWVLIDQGTVAYIVIQSAIDYIGGLGGGLITVLEALYIMANVISIPYDDVILEGVGTNTVFQVKDEPSTTLTVGANIGDTILNVANTAGFVVGEQIQIEVGAGYELRTIGGIGANTITVTVALAAIHALGINVFSVMNTISITGDSVTIRNFKIDGNEANWPVIDVQCGVGYEIYYFDSDYLLIEEIETTNSRHRPIDGAADHTTINKCYFHDMSVNGGVHIEGVADNIWNHVRIVNSIFIMPSGIGTATQSLLVSFGEDLVMDGCYIFGHVYIRTTNNSKIINCFFEPNDYDLPTQLYGCYNITFDNNTFNAERFIIGQVTIALVTYYAYLINITSNDFIDDANVVVGSESHEIKFEENIFTDFDSRTPLEVTAGSGTEVENVDITNNTFNNVTIDYTIKIAYCIGLLFRGNKQVDCTRNEFQYCNQVNLSENIFDANTGYVFRIRLDTFNIQIINNILFACTSRGISLETNTTDPDTRVHIRGNFLGATTPYMNDGTYTHVDLPHKVFQFTEPIGTAAWQLTSPTGIVVDAADEGALALGWVPFEAQQVVQFRIVGVALAAPGAGNQMRLAITINAGKPTGHEAYNAEAISVANKNNTEENPAVNDAIEWIITASDDPDVDDIGYGETFECFAVFAAAGDSDIATNALIRTVTVEYV